MTKNCRLFVLSIMTCCGNPEEVCDAVLDMVFDGVLDNDGVCVSELDVLGVRVPDTLGVSVVELDCDCELVREAL